MLAIPRYLSVGGESYIFLVGTFYISLLVILTWYDFTSYSIVLHMSVSAWFLRHWIICLRCTILRHNLNHT